MSDLLLGYMLGFGVFGAVLAVCFLREQWLKRKYYASIYGRLK